MRIAVLSCRRDRSGAGAPLAASALGALRVGLREHGHQVEELDADHPVVTDADVLHAHGWAAGVRAMAQPGLRGRPLVQSFAPPSREAPLTLDGAAVQRLLTSPAAQLVATSPAEVRALRVLGAGPDRISVVPPYVDTDIFRPDGVRAARTSAHRITLVGGIGPADGAEDVVRLLPLLGRSQLVVLGPTGADPAARTRDRRRLALLADRLGVADRLVFLPGSSPHSAAAVLRSTSVCVLLPRHDLDDTRMVLPAMACGVPVVGTPVGGLTEVLEDRVTGLLVPPGRVEEAADAVHRLLANDAWRGWLGVAAADHVEARHGPAALARNTEAVYRAAARHRGAVDLVQVSHAS